MDNLTHGLLGVAIGMLRKRDGGPEHDAPLSETDKAVPWATFLAAEMPDLDVLLGGDSPLDEYVHHRGWTHSLAAAPLIALAAALLVKAVWRQARLGTVYAWSLASILIAHLANDWMTGWGTRLLLPFSEARLALDWVPIIDLLYTVPLLAAVLIAWRRPKVRQKAMAVYFIYLGVYLFGYRAISHTVIDSAVWKHYAPAGAVKQVRVAPDLFNPLAWQFTVDLGDRYEQGRVYPFGPIKATSVLEKAPEDDVIRAVREAPELKPFFDQFPYALVTYKKTAEGYEVEMGDVRYRFRGRGMSYFVKLSADLKVLGVSSGGW